MLVCPVCETKAKDENQEYCLTCAWEFEYFFEELSEEEKKRYNNKLKIHKSVYEKSQNIKTKEETINKTENFEKKREKTHKFGIFSYISFSIIAIITFSIIATIYNGLGFIVIIFIVIVFLKGIQIMVNTFLKGIQNDLKSEDSFLKSKIMIPIVAFLLTLAYLISQK